jgi:hypothetical protein
MKQVWARPDKENIPTIVRRKFIQGIAYDLGTANAGAGVPNSTVKDPDRTCGIEYNSELMTEGEMKCYIQELGCKARGGTN